MGRKHGGIKTPVKPMGYAGNAGVFNRRGDAWVSPKEQHKDFGRNIETENPDLDRHLFAKKASPKPVYLSKKKSAFDTGPSHQDYQRTAAQINLRMQSQIRKAEIGNQGIKLRVVETEEISCPYGCGFKSKDSRIVSAHLRGSRLDICKKRK